MEQNDAAKLGKLFAQWLLENADELFGYEISEDICEKILIPAGVTEYVAYNRELHGENWDWEEGDMIYHWTPKMKEVADV